MSSVYDRPATFRNLLRFTLPTIAMTLFTSLYTMVDGLFVSRYVGTTALSALNIVMPLAIVLSSISVMLATGGVASVMKTMGEKRELEGRQDFSMLIVVNVVVGIVITILGILFHRPLVGMMGATGQVAAYGEAYLLYFLIFSIPFLLRMNLEQFLIAAGKSELSFFMSVAGGVINIMLDYLFVARWGLGVEGAAVATGIGNLIPCILMLLLFFRKSMLLYFVRPVFRWRVLLKSSTNGSSEMVTMLLGGVVTYLFNNSMLRYAGEEGVAAIGIVLYLFQFVSAIFMGYTWGVAPMISYYYGEQSRDKLRQVIWSGLRFVVVVSVACTVLSFALSRQLVGVFTPAGTPVYDLSISGNRLFAFALLLTGFNAFVTGMFTAFSNGAVSALLSFIRTFVLQVGALVALPLLWGVTGIWLATPLAEAVAVAMSVIFFVRYKKRYGY